MLRNSVESAAPAGLCPFHAGDRVYMAKGSYQGSAGTFLNLRSDPKWADIRESSDLVRAHPVEWMEIETPAERGTRL